jgi:hypothetical protein
MFEDQFNVLVNTLNIKEYFPKYTKGSIIKSVDNSVGIMCFKTYEEAQKFIINKKLGNGYDIIKVKGIDQIHNGLGGYKIAIFQLKSSDISDIKNKRRYKYTVDYISFDKVKVLE